MHSTLNTLCPKQIHIRTRLAVGLAVMALLALHGVQQSWADPIQWSDDFSTDTTTNYNTTYWPYYGASATPSILYDASNQRAIVQAVGGYGHIVMEKNGESPIPAGSDFTFSADVSILSEHNGYLYLGDNQPIWASGTCLRLNIGNFAGYNLDLNIDQNGTPLTDLRTSYTPQSSNNLKITRVSDEYSFYLDNNLVWQQAIPTLDGMPLYYGVGNEISSGPSGITAQTAFDNLNFIPEPSTLSLLVLGGLLLLRRRKN